jgi:uncharacterized protein (DUF433 family)
MLTKCSRDLEGRSRAVSGFDHSPHPCRSTRRGPGLLGSRRPVPAPSPGRLYRAEGSRQKYAVSVKFSRITADPERFGGMPCVRDLRFPVATVVAIFADGMTFDEILTEHPDLEMDDLRKALH